MYQPQMYFVVLGFMLMSMLCWGSWANTLKLCRGFRFQLFYWDYLLGLGLGAGFWGLTLGSHGKVGMPFLAQLVSVSGSNALLAFLGGAVFNVANLLLVAAIEIAGLSVAFPVGIGLALVIGAAGNYFIAPKGNPVLLFGGILLVIAAIITDAGAYRLREQHRVDPKRRGIVISVIAGVLMGCFYPFVSAAMAGTRSPGPYVAVLFFVSGVIACAIPFNSLLMHRPLDGDRPATMNQYSAAPFRFHCWGVLGGVIWCTGAVLNFVASGAHLVGPAVSYSIGQGATMVSASWGVFVWREFAQAPAKARAFLVWMFVLFICGLTAIAIAPLFA